MMEDKSKWEEAKRILQQVLEGQTKDQLFVTMAHYYMVHLLIRTKVDWDLNLHLLDVVILWILNDDGETLKLESWLSGYLKTLQLAIQ